MVEDAVALWKIAIKQYLVEVSVPSTEVARGVAWRVVRAGFKAAILVYARHTVEARDAHKKAAKKPHTARVSVRPMVACQVFVGSQASRPYRRQDRRRWRAGSSVSLAPSLSLRLTAR